MAHSATTKAARKAARVAAMAAQQEMALRTRANMQDLTAFFSARQRAEEVDDWLKGKVAGLQEQAAQRRDEQRVECGAALRAMNARGESAREIARMAGVGEKTVRELIRLAEDRRAAGADVAGQHAGVNGAAGPGATAKPSNGHGDVAAAVNGRGVGQGW
jgi:hypothetical protein